MPHDLNKKDPFILHNTFCQYALLEKGYAKGTIRNYKYSWRLLNEAFHLDDIEKINDVKLREFLYRGIREKKWTNHAIVQHHKNLSPFFEWCAKHKYIRVNPFKNIDRPDIEVAIPEHFSNKEIEKIMSFIDRYRFGSEFVKKRNYAILSFLLMLGVRRNELLGLEMSDVDLCERRVKIRAATSKSKKDRLLPMPQRLRDILIEYMAERRRLRKTTSSFFVSLYRNSGYTNSGLKRLLKLIQVNTGIYVHTHKFRHTFATKALESGVDIRTLQRLMGHSCINSTSRYLHTTVEHLQEQIEKNKINFLV